MLGCTGAGTECLKNLILPGFGSISIASNKKVQNSDLGANFFLRDEAVTEGKNLAEECLTNLVEMNPDVNKEDSEGTWYDVDPEIFLDTHRNICDKATVIIADGISFKTCLKLDSYIQANGKEQKLCIIKSLGLIGYTRICIGEYTSYETKNAMITLEDYKVTYPWPELEKWVESLDMENLAPPPPNFDELKNMSDAERANVNNQTAHCHVPFVAILIHFWKKYATLHPDPKSRNSLDFKSLLKSHAIYEDYSEKKPLNNWRKELNYKEAIMNINLIKDTKDTIPHTGKVQNALNWLAGEEKKECTHSYFFYLLKALRTFKETYGEYPQTSQVGDMESSNNFYLKLKELYLEKHKADVEQFKTILRNDLVTTIYKDVIGDSEHTVKEFHENCTNFVKNWKRITAFNVRSLNKEFEQVKFDDFALYCDTSMPMWYWGIRGLDEFKEKNNGREANPNDFKVLSGLINEIIERNGHMENVTDPEANLRYNVDQIAKELCRYEGLQQMTTAAIIGGVASAEILKLTTRNYECMNNTFVYDGIQSTGNTHFEC